MLAGYTTSKTRKSEKSITRVQDLLFLSLSLNEKKVKVLSLHSTVRHFCVIWQSSI